VQWKAERETLRLMYDSAVSEKNFLIHPSVLPECTVSIENSGQQDGKVGMLERLEGGIPPADHL
jgi:hypothetical protein